MKKNNILFLLMAAAAAVSCYKEAPLTPDEDSPEYIIEDGDDPARKYIYGLWKDTGVYTLYEYDDVDYSWDISSTSYNHLVRMDAAVLEDAVDYARTVLFDNYDDAFMKKYFPLKVFLADSVNHDYDADVFRDRICGYGRSYIALGRLRPEAFPKSAEELLTAKGQVNGTLWGQIIYRNSLMEIPDGFFSPGNEYYRQSASSSDQRDDPSYVKSLGFWSYDETNLAGDYMFPDMAGDVSDFVEMITTHTEEEMKAEMEGYETLLVKYNILLNAVQEACGVDLQAIGDNKPL